MGKRRKGGTVLKVCTACQKIPVEILSPEITLEDSLQKYISYSS
jgi:hypothetical protein